MCLFLPEDSLFILGEDIDSLICARCVIYLSDESSLAEILAMLLKTPLVNKSVDISKDLSSSHARQRVAKKGRLRDTTLAANVRIVIDEGAIAAGVAMAFIDVIILVRSFIVCSWRRHDAG